MDSATDLLDSPGAQDAGPRSGAGHIALLAALGLIAYWLVAFVPLLAQSNGESMVLRGLAAGLVVGLTLRAGARIWIAPLVACASSIGGAALIAVTSSQPTPLWGVVLGVACAGIAAISCTLAVEAGHMRWAEIVSVAIVVLIGLWTIGISPGTPRQVGNPPRMNMLRLTPPTERYGYDGWIYLRTYLSMRQGTSYYAAYKQAFIDHKALDEDDLTSPFNYREPLVFYLWRVLPGSNGYDLFLWFGLLTSVTLVLSYVIASSLTSPGVALLAPLSLMSLYTLLAWLPGYFLLTEPWACAFALAALACLLKKQRIASIAFLVLAVATREFMVVLIPAWLAVWWLAPKRRENVWFPAAAVLLPVAAVGVHMLLVPPTSGGVETAGFWISARADRLVAALRYGSEQILRGKYIALAIPALAIAAALLAKARWRQAALLAVTTLPLLLLFLFSGGQWSDYWGAFYTPIAASIAPGVLGRVLPPR